MEVTSHQISEAQPIHTPRGRDRTRARLLASGRALFAERGEAPPPLLKGWGAAAADATLAPLLQPVELSAPAPAPRSVRRKKKKKRRDVMLRRDCDALVPREYRIWQIEHIEALRRNRDDPASPMKRAAAPATIAHIEALRAAEDPTSPLRRAAAPAAAPAAPRGFGERFSRGRRLVFGADDEAVAPAPPPEAPVPPVTATVGFLPA